MSKKAIIIGAGPAGLTAAYELLKRTDIIPIVLEKSGDIGGISKTVNYKGNRIDIGGHRFFSKSDRVMNWWLNIMPLQAEGQTSIKINYQNKSRELNPSHSSIKKTINEEQDKIMMIRKRISRIYFLGKFFSYPIRLSIETLHNLGFITTILILASYMKSQLLPRKPENSLEDFMINRFGQVLYRMFFKDYTEKVWGVPCNRISADWGAQRIKGISVGKAIRNAVQSTLKGIHNNGSNDIRQKETETSLIEQFLYPKYGPGQLWEEVAKQIESMGGKILTNHDVKNIFSTDCDAKIAGISALNTISGESISISGEYFFSTMPIQELIGAMDGTIPNDVREVASGLQYRDFITVGILIKNLSFVDKITNKKHLLNLKDNWIYIQEKDVRVGRIQLFNNWSPHMVNAPDTVWIGMEFFCNKEDDFWKKSDSNIQQLAINELIKINLACNEDVLDATVIRVEKTYPAYFGTYSRFDTVREYLDKFENLFLIGRNGMHKYNNADHSMLTAMTAVDNIVSGAVSKENIWKINTEQDYSEEKSDIIKKKRSFVCTNPHISFKDFVFKKNRKTTFLIAIILLIQFIGFKFLYPFANFMPDSYAYLEAAFGNWDINMWPIGYSKFLRIFSGITYSDTALVFVQYFLLSTSILYLLFTLWYVTNSKKIAVYIPLTLFILNPLLLSTANYISSDALFTSLSLIWVVQLVWILYRHRSVYIWTQAIVLLLAFSVRYNALYYPIITIVVLAVSRFNWLQKALGIVLSVSVILSFVWTTCNKFNEITGQKQFSPFGGWQMANNALFMYSHIENDNNVPPKQFHELHNVTKKHMDSLRHLQYRPDAMLGIYYLWDEKAPLKKYMASKWGNDTTISSAKYFMEWSSMAKLYSAYGTYLIQRYPIPFASYYLWPNMINYYVPPVEFLGLYNMKETQVKPIAQVWFKYRKPEVTGFWKEINILKIYSVLFALINLLFIYGTLVSIFLKKHKNTAAISSKGILLLDSVLFLNFFFSVFASPIVLRYQLFPMILLACATILTLQIVFRNENNKTANEI